MVELHCFFFFNTLFYLAAPGLSCGLVGSGSLTRDQIRAPCSGSRVLNTAPPREVPTTLFFFLRIEAVFFNFYRNPGHDQKNTRNYMETEDETQDSSQLPRPSVGRTWGEAAGADLEPQSHNTF